LVGLGRVLLRQGRIADARKSQEEARAIRERLGAKSAVTESRVALAEILIEEGRADEAVAAARDAAHTAHEQGQSDTEARACAILATGLLERHQASEARDALGETAKLRRTEWDRGTRMQIDIATARVDAALGVTQAATTRLDGVLAE